MTLSKEQRLAFCIGSFVGLGQALLGLAISANYGSWAAFFASWGTYILFLRIFTWAAGTKEEQPKP